MMPVEQETSYFDYIAQLDWAGLQREEQLIRSKIKLVQIIIDMHYCERINNSTADIDANWEYYHTAVTASDIYQGIVRFPRKSSFAVKTHKKQIHVDCGNGKEKRIINNSGRICGLKEYFSNGTHQNNKTSGLICTRLVLELTLAPLGSAPHQLINTLHGRGSIYV